MNSNNKMGLRLMICRFGFAGVLMLSGALVQAQEFPSKVVRIVVPTEPGGTVDFVARLLAQRLGETWKRGVIVENRAGAGGVIGADYIAKAASDGHTLGLVTTSFTTNAATNGKLPYDSLRDFTPVTLVAFSTYILVTNPNVPVRTMKDLIDLAKRKPGELNYASAGNGGSLHLATEMLNGMAGIKMVHVPYKGTVPAVNDVIGGQVQATITSLVAAMPLVNAGKLRLIAVTGTNRSMMAPDTPTIGETVPGFEFNNWFGILAPRGTPKEIVTQLHAAIAKVVQIKEVRDLMLAQSVEPAGLGSEQFETMMRTEIGRYSKLVKDIGIKVE